jgi:hypothetical protein
MNEGLRSAVRVYSLLGSQAFVDWYENVFIPHIEGDDKAASKKAVVEWLRENI